MKMELQPYRKEIIRYLGYRGVTPDEEVLREIEACVLELNRAVTPRFVYERFALSLEKEDNGEESLCFAGLRVHSRDLAVNLQGCREVCLMAVTLGPGPDLLVRRASVGRMSRAVILQATAAAMTETWCDRINRRIRLEAEQEGLYTRPRFSPGYGDLPLDLQREISAILNMPKEIGVSLTDTMLMTPSKSVTALIGISDTPGKCAPAGCAGCAASANCAYARTETES